jgi:hypothetical protein
MTIAEREKATPKCPTCKGHQGYAAVQRLHGADEEEELTASSSSGRSPRQNSRRDREAVADPREERSAGTVDEWAAIPRGASAATRGRPHGARSWWRAWCSGIGVPRAHLNRLERIPHRQHPCRPPRVRLRER